MSDGNHKKIEELGNFKSDLHFFICTNDRTKMGPDAKPSCGPWLNEATVKEFKLWLRSLGLHKKINATRTGCLGGCNAQGAVLCEYPQGKYFKGFQSLEDLKKFFLENYNK